ncbi:hypothetical protein B0T16DRAFT_454025 [Cercophora newfieldiana]|uniref:J domain-containing protein n=1 Tax=Cercophora newfieldiana TaxID=92897 RepID=A0AA39YF97_9PEZI|nr:hypothetical protein B0T16DRAFT_454025 [Cercophora newfieldiana]
MPLRNPPLGALLTRLHASLPRTTTTTRPFHSSPRLQDDTPSPGRDHYETLNVHPEASQFEIKRSYFALSKAHHPDHNPSDPHASRRFMRISEAYSILGHAEKRARYDRDVLRRPHPVPHRAHPKGSYHSSQSQTGGRPASGLSRRRGTFQGPPPSFFRSGGWGSYSEKRRAAHEETTGTGPAGSSGASAGAQEGTGTYAGGMGPGQNPYRSRADRYNDVPHFDREAHERTHRRHQERRERRTREAKGLNPFGTESGPVADFFVVAAIVAAGVLGPYLLIGMWMAGDNKGRKRKKAIE